MKRRKLPRKKLLVFASFIVVAATASLPMASATERKAAVVPPDAVLTWNTYAVNAVRTSVPTKVQTDGMVYMSYVQAAVYDAVTKLEGRYQPYHDFAFAVVPGASVQAAVAAAAQTILDNYLPDRQATVDAEYTAYIATLSGDVADGVAVGEAAAQDIIALRTGDGLNAATPSYGGIGPILPGQWQLQPGQAVQTPWLATMRPFLLERASQFRAQPPPALTSHAVREGPERDRGVRRAQQHRPHSGADGDRVLLGREQHQPVQPDDAERRHRARHGSRRRRASARDGEHRLDRRGHRLLRLEVLLPRVAPDHGDPERRQGRQSRHDGRPDVAGAARSSGPSRVSVPARLLHRGLQRRARRGAAHEAHRRHDGRRTERKLASSRRRQHFDTVNDIQKQVVDARVWLGFHFRNSVEQGEKLGNNVADWELKRFFQPVHS